MCVCTPNLAAYLNIKLIAYQGARLGPPGRTRSKHSHTI